MQDGLEDMERMAWVGKGLDNILVVQGSHMELGMALGSEAWQVDNHKEQDNHNRGRTVEPGHGVLDGGEPDSRCV